ncbi:MAG: DUF2281 domain-containing protein [Cyanobacteria bacterium J06607_13]
MTATEKLTQLIKVSSDQQIAEILTLAESLHQKQNNTSQSQTIPAGTLTGLRGIANQPGHPPSDDSLQADYINYLISKYQ